MTQCTEQKWLSTEEYLTKFLETSRQLRVPLSGSLEVTHDCNLRCVHCYLGPQAKRQKHDEEEMDTGRIQDLIDEIADAGCLYLLLTGGEPLLREDFSEIYSHAKEQGLLVTVFSNGTLMTEKHLALFRELPPREVEITLYGATPLTYENITGVSGSYKACLDGIRRLLDAHIRVNLKTILMTINRHELCEMERMARSFGCRFRFDAAISPGMGGEKTPLQFRVPPAEAVRLELSDDQRISQWKTFLDASEGHTLVDEMYGCGAGVTGFHIDPFGNLQPCLMTLDMRYNLSQGPFLTGWNDIVSRIRDKKAAPDFACRGCGKINLCGYCPAFFRLENGGEGERSEYICTMGELRYQRITHHYPEGDHND
jgi:radical SAM protein with 4Fe4S-binding SPASM domain